MKKQSVIVLSSILLAACEPEATRIEDIDLSELDGMQSECASRAANAAMQSFSDDVSWTDLTSVDGTAEAVVTIKDATALELQKCLTDIYLMGIEDGRVTVPLT